MVRAAYLHGDPAVRKHFLSAFTQFQALHSLKGAHSFLVKQAACRAARGTRLYYVVLLGPHL